MNLKRELRGVLADPTEWAIAVRERWAERHEQRAKATQPLASLPRASLRGIMPWPPCPYVTDPDWERHLHEDIGVPWPCPAHRQFHIMWPEVIRMLQERVPQVGRGSFGVDGWSDGDTAFARTVYCLTLHLRPERIVETGVARGITSRFILEAIAHNGYGHLWSIDLPPIAEPEIHDQVGVAVTDDLRHSWTYVRGSSRRRLSPLLTELGTIDMFVHDSKHTERNLLFELNRAWDALGPTGLVVADDVDLNCGFHAFRAARPDVPIYICVSEPLQPDTVRQGSTGVFAVSLKFHPATRT